MHEQIRHSPDPIIVGIDLGGTIFDRDEPGGPKFEYPNAVETIRLFVKRCKAVHIVSRVNPEQKIRAQRWLVEAIFHERTGLPLENVHFCAERCDKAPICDRLKVTHFIDDRPEVMHYLPDNVFKILHRPDPEDLSRYAASLKNCHPAQTWLEVRELVFASISKLANPDLRREDGHTR